MALSPQFGMTIVLCANMSGLDVPVPTSSVYPTPKYPPLATRDDILGFYASDPANALPPLGPSALPIVLPVRRRDDTRCDGYGAALEVASSGSVRWVFMSCARN